MGIIIKRFNESGLREFEQLLIDFTINKTIDEEKLDALVFSDYFTIEVENVRPLSLGPNNGKFEIVKSITYSLDLETRKDFYNDKGLWSWLSALILKRLVPTIKNSNQRRFGERALYILETSNWNRYYRHLLAFPCWIYSSLKDKGRIFLRGEICERGEIVEQLASTNIIQRNLCVVEAATMLYYDPQKDDVYKGAASKPNESKNLGGQARRFREILKQFEMTFDLNAMSGNQIIELLPREFDRWKKNYTSPLTLF